MKKEENISDSILDRINQGKMINSPLININKHVEVYKSICKIITSNQLGTGFFIKLNVGKNPFNFLMTNEHVITQEMIEKKKEVEIKYENQKKSLNISLDVEKRMIKDFLYLNIDVVIIQILPKDEIQEDFFLLPNIEYLNGYEQFENKQIFILQYAAGGELQCSAQIIKKINLLKNEFSHLSSTLKGSSGSPIFIKGSTYVLGIHKQTNKKETINYANFIGPIIDALRKEVKIEKKQLFNWSYEGEMVNGKKEGNGRLVFKNGNFYVGQFKNNKYNGKGIFYYRPNAIKYMGDFVDNYYEGNGIIFYENGEFYEGQFKKGLKQGRGCEYYKDKNIKYKGEFFKNIYNGSGKYIYQNGYYYEGNWMNGRKHGKGTYYKYNNKPIYIGDYINNIEEGNGIYYYDNGDYYKGQFKNGQKNGKGIVYSKNDNIKLEGYFLNNIIEGECKLYCGDGSLYIGQIQNGEKNGKGIIFSKKSTINKIIIFEDDENQKSSDLKSQNNEYITNTITDIKKKYTNLLDEYEIIYYGEFKNDKKNGNGIIFYNNYQEMYEGEFKDDQPDGKGKYIDKEGNQFLGEFIKGKKNGNFIINNMYKELIFKGNFVNDKKEGHCLCINNKTKVMYKGNFKNGKRYGYGQLFDGSQKLIYSGNFYDDEPDYFDLYYIKEKTYYLGEKRNGLANGLGKLYDKSTKKVIYEGDFLDGKLEGHGKLYKENNLIYEGSFKNDLPNGKGLLYKSNISNLIYKGDFVDGFFEGYGKLINKDGSYYKGQFIKGKSVGYATIYDRNNKFIYKGKIPNNNLLDLYKYLYFDKFINGLINGNKKENTFTGAIASIIGFFILNKIENK